MARTEGGQPGLLDLVDDRRNPDVVEPVVERARARPPDVVDDGRFAASLSDSTTAGGTSPRGSRSSSGLWRSITSGGCSRSTKLISACVSGSEPGCSPGLERFVRFATTRRSSSIPGGYVKESSGRHVAAGKLRFRSTPAAFCRVPLISPSGLATGTTTQRVASPETRSSRRRASRAVTASSPCWAATSSPAVGPFPSGKKARRATPSRERPYSSTRQPWRRFPVTALP